MNTFYGLYLTVVMGLFLAGLAYYLRRRKNYNFFWSVVVVGVPTEFFFGMLTISTILENV